LARPKLSLRGAPINLDESGRRSKPRHNRKLIEGQKIQNPKSQAPNAKQCPGKSGLATTKSIGGEDKAKIFYH
jgi:hypothetical protein